jgi:tetratricopeptide (TPR) repeat protein
MKISVKAFSFLAGMMATVGVSAQTLQDAIKMTSNERYEAASAAFKKILKSGNDQGGDAWFYYGNNFLEWNVLDSAKMMFQKGSETKPSNPLNFVGLGSVAWMEHSAEQAKQFFYKATSLTTTQAKEIPKEKQTMVYLKIAEAYLKANKNLPEALVNINLAMKISPKDPEVYIQLGDYSIEKNTTDVSEAIKNYEKAGELDKTSTRAILRQGQVWVRVQNYEDGLKFYRQAIQMDSTFAPAFRARGDLYFRYAKYKAAIADYRKYLAMNDGQSAKQKYAQSLFFTKDYKTAIEEIKAVQRKDSSNLTLMRYLAYSYYETGDFTSGLSTMQRFLMRQELVEKPKLINKDYAYYGKLLSKNGNDSVGIEQLKKAIAMDSSFIDSYGDIASIYFKTKNPAEAAKYYELKIGLERKSGKKVNPLDYIALGKIYFSNKDYVKADTAFARTTDIYPVYSNAWRARCNASLDNQDKPEGKAKPFWELAICKAGTDVERNKKDLIDAYAYLGFFYLSKKNYDCSKASFMKVQELDATNDKAKLALEDKMVKPASGNCDLIKNMCNK